MNKILKYPLYIGVIMGLLAACGNDYEVIMQNKIDKYPEIKEYISQLENENSDYKGYKVFNISNGKKVVVISSGEEGKNLKLTKVNLSSLDTSIAVENGTKNEDANPFILVALDDIKGALYVYDQNGEELDGSGYYKKDNSM